MINIDIDRQRPETALRQAAWQIAIGEAGYWMSHDRRAVALGRASG